jgi:hypothetical protein
MIEVYAKRKMKISLISLISEIFMNLIFLIL